MIFLLSQIISQIIQSSYLSYYYLPLDRLSTKDFVDYTMNDLLIRRIIHII